MTLTTEQLAALREVAEHPHVNYFHAAFDPTTCLGLLEEVERYRKEDEDLRAAVQDVANQKLKKKEERRKMNTNSPEALPQGGDKIDFACRVCGIQCAIAPDAPERAVCTEHCEDHNYVYSREDRGTFCEYCWQEAPHDYYLED